MNTTEIDSALVNFQATYPDLCQRIELPEKTSEGRTCHALRIAKNHSRDKLAVLIIGGVHAREWGGPDIVVNFAGCARESKLGRNASGSEIGRTLEILQRCSPRFFWQYRF